MGIDPATLFLISTGISVVGTIQQGKLARQAYAEESRRLESEKQTAYLQGLQEELERRRDTERTLSNNRVFLSGSGISESGSFNAIQEDVVNIAAKDIASIRLNVNNSLTNYDRAILNSKIERQSSDLGTIFGAGATIANGWAYASYYKSPTTTNPGAIKELRKTARG
jgi:hypothetical protein